MKEPCADLPIVLQVEELPIAKQPKSQTICLTDHWIDPVWDDLDDEDL